MNNEKANSMNEQETKTDQEACPLDAIVRGGIGLQELRCGNLLNYTTAEGDVLPTKIDWQDLKWLDEEPESFNLCHNPIEITKKYLISVGFEPFQKGLSKNAWSPGHPSQRFDIDWSEETGIMCKSRYQGDSDYFFMRHIKYVHQLQNLYYSLTGEELDR